MIRTFKRFMSTKKNLRFVFTEQEVSRLLKKAKLFKALGIIIFILGLLIGCLINIHMLDTVLFNKSDVNVTIKSFTTKEVVVPQTDAEMITYVHYLVGEYIDSNNEAHEIELDEVYMSEDLANQQIDTDRNIRIDNETYSQVAQPTLQLWFLVLIVLSFFINIVSRLLKYRFTYDVKPA